MEILIAAWTTVTVAKLLAIIIGIPLIVYAVMFTVRHLRNWFLERKTLMANRNNVGFSFKEKLANGQFKVVMGIFDPITNTVADRQGIRAESVNREMEDLHAQEDMLIFPQR